MFWRILMKSLGHRWNRVAVTLLAVTMGASLAAAALSVSVGMEDKVGQTLRAYGANIVLSPKTAALGVSDATFNSNDLVHLNHVSPIVGYAPMLYTVIDVRNQPLVLVGSSFDAVTRVNPWWQVEGSMPAHDDPVAALVGASVADKWRVKIGDELPMRYRETPKTFRITGIVSTGGEEDDQVFVSLAAAQALTSRPGQLSLVQISALTTQIPIEETTRTIEQMIPDAQAKTVRQIAEGEVALIRRVQLLLALIAAIVLFAAAVSVGATMTTVMLERRREIGLMKAIGADVRRIGALCLAEAGAIGIAGGIFGYALGFALAQVVAQSVFSSSVDFNAWVGVSALAIAVIVAVIGSVIPMQRALAVEAAIVLRGE